MENNGSTSKGKLHGKRMSILSSNEDWTLSQIMMPLINALRIFGLIWDTSKGFPVALCCVSCIIIHIGILAYFINVLYSMHIIPTKFETVLLLKVCAICYGLQIVLNTMIFTVSWRRCFNSLEKTYNEYRLKYSALPSSELYGYCRKVVITLFCAYVPWYAGCATLLCFLVKDVPLKYREVFQSLFPGDFPFMEEAAYFMTFNSIVTCVWLLPGIATLLMAVIFRKEIIHFIEQLSTSLLTSTITDEVLENYRCQHLALANIVRKFDNIFKKNSLITFILNLAIICFQIVVVALNSNASFAVVGSGIVSLCIYTIPIILITSAGVLLITKGRQVSKVLYQLDFNKCSSKQIQIVQIFIAQCQPSPIGMTVGGVLAIDKGVIITIVTLTTTYVFALFKMLMPPASCKDSTLDGTLFNIMLNSTNYTCMEANA